ncbi:putative glycerophosphoryl diester phosphodiesterase 2 [Acorus gramineus]|uniref:glycerophosphodiester phosphodiesterase n=1 Tax=Acorus gramineus TaxID=55184 RepID=A0AAV9BCL0_ACOGR|nr:putative glycerophosphoryl diester phosphodiesterase 2 [Acorus gramineus]
MATVEVQSATAALPEKTQPEELNTPPETLTVAEEATPTPIETPAEAELKEEATQQAEEPKEAAVEAAAIEEPKEVEAEPEEEAKEAETAVATGEVKEEALEASETVGAEAEAVVTEEAPESTLINKNLFVEGNAPIVIAEGGFSGLFPDSSFNSYQLALNTSLPDTVLWCNVHLTKDGFGICLPNILLNNSTNVASVYPKVNKTYLVNGVAMGGWFSMDFTLNDLRNVSLGFLRSVAKRLNRTKTKLIFRFLESNAIEPSTKISYASLLKNLTFIKTFAAGILVPKYYIWPVNRNLYVEPHTSVVTDAHKAGLEIYASEFANDARFAYNYSYDPMVEYLSFIDNTEFSVDGVLSQFPITPSAAIAKPLVISNNGASGVYPGCTDLSYIQAVKDGADIIDCNVQVTSDNVPICLTSIDLSDGTTAVEVPLFRSRMSIVPEIKNQPGIFSFNFTWEEIKNLTPRISNPFIKFMPRNPAYKNAGNFWSLSEFLNYAKAQPLVGVLLNIENAVYLSTQQGIGIVDIVLDILNTAGFNNMTDPQVFIQSKDSAVLARLKRQTMYKLLYLVDETISDVTDTAIQDIKSFAHSVVINKKSIYSTNMAFITSKTNVVQKLQSANLSVYTYLFQNEFQAQAWDFFSDPTVELNTFVQEARIDGVITDFPGTATAYKKNTCLKLKKTPKYMKPVQVGSLLGFIRPNLQPPAQAPSPVLTEADVVAEPPLPPVSVSPVPPPPRNGQAHREIPILLSLALMIGFLFIFI